MVRLAASVTLSFLAVAAGQKAGSHVEEGHPPMPFWECDSASCVKQTKAVTLDANWRWVHNGEYTNCYKGTEWNEEYCPDGEECAKNCYLEGVSTSDYQETYGVSTDDEGISLTFLSKTENGANYGSRLYLMEDSQNYKMFKLKNREFTLDVDMMEMPCGLNGAVYFVEMAEDGGKDKSNGLNKAGAKYGTGYCDAQCPHDIKFIDGEANVKGWDSESNPPIGDYGICCAEMDIWEANSRATAYTPHPCDITGTLKCTGTECGDNTADERYDGVCDKDGCDFNSYRMGDKLFYGREGDFKVDATRKVTVVTQFITSDGTDTGDLVDIRRFYVQDGQVLPNSNSTVPGVRGNSITDDFCSDMKRAFGDTDDFKRKGGMKAMGEALDRGMVLVFSLWDDSMANMLWLDSVYPADSDPKTPGVLRGPCKTTSGTPEYVRANFPDATARYTNVRFGPIGSTFGPQGGEAKEDSKYGDDRRLGAVHV